MIEEFSVGQYARSGARHKTAWLRSEFLGRQRESVHGLVRPTAQGQRDGTVACAARNGGLFQSEERVPQEESRVEILIADLVVARAQVVHRKTIARLQENA